jgi:hypothetical protein
MYNRFASRLPIVLGFLYGLPLLSIDCDITKLQSLFRASLIGTKGRLEIPAIPISPNLEHRNLDFGRW